MFTRCTLPIASYISTNCGLLADHSFSSLTLLISFCGSVGQPFNADTMEAIMAMPAADGEESGIVKQAYLKGYKKGDKVLRYAQVIVTQ